MIFLPECFDFVGENKEQSVAMAEPLSGATITEYKKLAKELKTWLSLGGFHEKVAFYVIFIGLFKHIGCVHIRNRDTVHFHF